MAIPLRDKAASPLRGLSPLPSSRAFHAGLFDLEAEGARVRRFASWLWLAVPVVVAAAGCSPAVPLPAHGPIASEELVEVPFPPPPVHVEIIPPKPKGDVVWVDGRWDWDGDAWRWFKGGWAEVPTGAHYTPWKTRRDASGRLMFSRAGWRDKAGHLIDSELDHASCPIGKVAK